MDKKIEEKIKHDIIEGVWTENNPSKLEDCSQVEADCFNAGYKQGQKNCYKEMREMIISNKKGEMIKKTGYFVGWDDCLETLEIDLNQLNNQLEKHLKINTKQK